jgi:hypothetical protein
MSRLDHLHAKKVVLLPLLDPRKGDPPMSRLHAEKIVLLPLLGGVIAASFTLPPRSTVSRAESCRRRRIMPRH